MADDFDRLADDTASALGTSLNGKTPQIAVTDDGILGSMREYADEMDEIVADAMRRRRISGWLPNRMDFAALKAIGEATS